MTERSVEALVVGGGLIGLAAAVAVARAGLLTLHLAPKAPPDRRTSALMGPSVDYLRTADLIADPAAVGVPLTEIRIIDATDRLIRSPETLFAATEAGLPAFGWNFPNVKLAEAFATAANGLTTLETSDALLANLEIGDDGAVATLSTGEIIRAALVVGADGKKSPVRAAAGFAAREHAFAEAALVCDLNLGRGLNGTSVEFHYPHGPFTLVPAVGNRANLVWIDEPAALQTAKAADASGLNAILREKSMRLFGTVTAVTPAQVFPLSTLTVDRAGGRGVVLAGESAHAFPPIGAQGLNLGLRDVSDLADALAAADRSQPGWAVRLSDDYAGRRSGDLARTGSMVDTLFRSLLSDLLPAQALRSGGLWAMKTLPGLRKQAFALGMGVR